MTEAQTVSVIGGNVQRFYQELPFNFAGDTANQAGIVSGGNQIAVYSPLHAILEQSPASIHILDAGCGAGWFTNSIAYWYERPCLGVDFTPRALERAEETAKHLNVENLVQFRRENLLDLSDEIRAQKFDLISSIGVLHHTADCRLAFENLAHLLAPGGYMHIGLYHAFGRAPLLESFEPFRSGLRGAATGNSQAEIIKRAYQHWLELYPSRPDDTLNQSWFRDQCLHPHETQWTLKEVLEWFEAVGIEAEATSLNRYGEVHDWESLINSEHEQRDIAEAYQRDGIYYPGFFMVSGWQR